jgi:hypothetical protein
LAQRFYDRWDNKGLYLSHIGIFVSFLTGLKSADNENAIVDGHFEYSIIERLTFEYFVGHIRASIGYRLLLSSINQ